MSSGHLCQTGELPWCPRASKHALVAMIFDAYYHPYNETVMHTKSLGPILHGSA